MQYTCLPYDPSLLPLYKSLAKTCSEQGQGEFPVPETEEGETGFLLLCKEGDELLGALSAVTFDSNQYFFYPWCLADYRQKVIPVLCQNLERHLSEHQDTSLLLSAYVKGANEDTACILRQQGFAPSAGEYLMDIHISQALSENRASHSSASIQCAVCHDQKTLQKLYQDIFSAGKREAQAYIASVIDEPDITLYTISGAFPGPSAQKRILTLGNRQAKEGVMGMFALLPQGDTVYLFSFGILPPYRRQGMGLAALQAVCAMLSSQYRKIAVQVSGSNVPAMELYRNFGFQVQEHVDLYEKELRVPPCI